MTLAGILFYIDSYHLASHFIVEHLDMAYLCFTALKHCFYIRTYYYFLGNDTSFIVRGLYVHKDNCIFKRFVLPTHIFCFAPLQVLAC